MTGDDLTRVLLGLIVLVLLALFGQVRRLVAVQERKEGRLLQTQRDLETIIERRRNGAGLTTVNPEEQYP
jgi:hypothetical protein